jgi:hypothetical protein
MASRKKMRTIGKEEINEIMLESFVNVMSRRTPISGIIILCFDSIRSGRKVEKMTLKLQTNGS